MNLLSHAVLGRFLRFFEAYPRKSVVFVDFYHRKSVAFVGFYPRKSVFAAEYLFVTGDFRSWSLFLMTPHFLQNHYM
mgnify:CR=1 FL=1